MRNKDVYSSYQWCLKVIESCVTRDQLNLAYNTIYNFYQQYKDDVNKRSIVTNIGYSTSALLFESLRTQYKNKREEIND